MSLDLAVIESRWWEGGNDSVQGLFELLATIRRENPHAYHYEMFNNASSLSEIISRVRNNGSVRNLYIAAHGNRRSIFGAEGRGKNRISREELAKMLGGHGRQLYGVYLSTCFVGNKRTARVLLDSSRISWVAGYSKEVNWLKGASLDLYFWDAYCDTNERGGPQKRIARVAETVKREMLPLCTRLGFNIFIRDGEGNAAPLL